MATTSRRSTMDAAEALRDMAAVALFVAALAVVWVEPVRERRADRRYAEQLREFKLAGDAGRSRADAGAERLRVRGRRAAARAVRPLLADAVPRAGHRGRGRGSA